MPRTGPRRRSRHAHRCNESRALRTTNMLLAHAHPLSLVGSGCICPVAARAPRPPDPGPESRAERRGRSHTGDPGGPQRDFGRACARLQARSPRRRLPRPRARARGRARRSHTWAARAGSPCQNVNHLLLDLVECRLVAGSCCHCRANSEFPGAPWGWNLHSGANQLRDRQGRAECQNPSRLRAETSN